MIGQKLNIRVAAFVILASLFIASCSGNENGFPIGGFESPGRKYLQFFADGTYTFGREKDEPIAKGQYRLEDQTITFYSETLMDGTPGHCPEDGVYTWTFEEDLLVFELVSDSCGPRITDTRDVNYYQVED